MSGKRHLSSAEDSASKHASDFQREILAGIDGMNSANGDNITRPRTTRPGAPSQAVQAVANQTRAGAHSQAIVNAGQSRTGQVTTKAITSQLTTNRTRSGAPSQANTSATRSCQSKNTMEPSIGENLNYI